MNAMSFLSNPIIDALGWTLLHAVWQGFALVLSVAVLLHLLRNYSSALRYRVGAITLLSQLVVSIITFVWYYEPATGNLPASARILTAQTMPVRWQVVAQTLPWHRQAQQYLETHLSQFVLIYFIGVALFGLRLAGGWWYLQRLNQSAGQPVAALWQQRIDQLRTALGIRVGVQVRESARIAVPMVVGVLKPILLLPFGLLTNLTTREIEAVLAHELAHIKRHDYAVNLLQSVVEVLYFFHPALWWLSERVREEREHCCDDLAVQVCGGDGRVLAQALAHVEEWRLAQIAPPTPALAMALTSKRQQLLHRVRRVLGVPTRPFVSNGSLAGLTLATLLLMSVSVYAVQQQDKPKRKTTQAKPTRRHKVDSNSEYGMVDNKKVSYVIWKGQKLPASRVARLQRQLDQVMAGQLSLDTVPQADRDILLTIIEKNNSFDEGMGALTRGLAHIDYDNIVASALKNVPLSPDGTVEGLARVNYDSIIQDAFASIQPREMDTDSVIQPDFMRVIRSQDSLAEQREINKGKKVVLEAKARSQEYAIEAVERAVERLERQKYILEQKRLFETSTQREVIARSSFTHKDSIRQTLLKQVESKENGIKKIETEIETLNHQLIDIQGDLIKAQEPLRETQTQLRQLNSSIYQGFTIPVAPTPPTRVGGHIVPAAPERVRVSPASPPTPPAGATVPRSAPKPATVPKRNKVGLLTEPQPATPMRNKGQFAKLGELIDNDPTIKTATFGFEPTQKQGFQVRSLTFTKHNDGDSQQPAKIKTKVVVVDSIMIK